MPIYKFREPAVERFLALSARYFFVAQPRLDERGRVVIEWPLQTRRSPSLSECIELPRREARVASR
ncbi:MAG TPA: hypothetical protein VGE16_08905 [Albitalea sp.]